MSERQWHYDFFSSSAEAIEFVNKYSPEKDGLFGMFEEGKIFQIWAREDLSLTRWDINYYKWNEENLTKFTKKIKDGKIIPIGFSKLLPPDVWFFEKR